MDVVILVNPRRGQYMSYDKSERSTIKEYASRYGVKVTHSEREGTLGCLTKMGTFIRF